MRPTSSRSPATGCFRVWCVGSAASGRIICREPMRGGGSRRCVRASPASPRPARSSSTNSCAPAASAKMKLSGFSDCWRFTTPPISPLLWIALLPEDLGSALERSEKDALPHLRFLDLLLGPSALARRERSVERRIREAQFKERPTLEAFDWSFNPQIDRLQFEDLATAD